MTFRSFPFAWRFVVSRPFALVALIVSICSPVAASDDLAGIFTRTGQQQAFAIWRDDSADGVTVADYEVWLGAPVDMTSFFVHHGSTSNWSWALHTITAPAYAQSSMVTGKQFLWSMPLVVNSSTTLAQAANGDFNSHYLQAAQGILSVHPVATGPIIVRPGWEFNGSWYDWAAQTPAALANYAEAFRQFVTTFRTISGRFRFEWCPNSPTYYQGSLVNVELAYPGDAYVDVISMDVYLYVEEGTPTNGASWFRYVRDANYGLQWMHNFATARGKAQSFAEWGVDADYDNDGVEDTDGQAAFVSLMMDWARDHNFLYHQYWESNLAYRGKLSGNGYPLTGQRFRRELGPVTITTSATHAVMGGEAFSAALQAATPVTWDIVGDNPDGFSLSGSTLSLPAQLYATGGGVRRVTVRATNIRGLTADRTFSVIIDPWIPSDATGIVREYDVRNLTLEDGTLVESWTDSSANGKHATPASAGVRPTYRAAGRNGMPSVEFDGVDDCFRMPVDGLPSGAAGMTVFAVASPTDGAGEAVIVSWGSASSARLRSLGVNQNGNPRIQTWGAGNEVSLSQAWPGRDRIVAASVNDGNLSIRSASEAWASVTPVVAINTAVDSNTGRIGVRAYSKELWLGHIQYVVIFDRALADAEVEKLEGWAAWTFNLVDELPSGHPYKESPPAKDQGDAAADADPDGDGLPNLLEYALGLDPLTPDSAGAVTLGKTEDNLYLTLMFNRIADPDLVYTVEATNDLASGEWDVIFVSTGTENIAGVVTVGDTDPIASHDRRFLRLLVFTGAVPDITLVEDTPRGYQRVTLPADTSSLGLPLLNEAVFSSSVDTVSGHNLTLGGPSGFNIGSLLSTEVNYPFYIEVTSGPLEGERLDVDVSATIAAGNRTVVLATDHTRNTLSTDHFAQLEGNIVALRRHITLAQIHSLFSPALTGSDSASAADSVYLFEGDSFIQYYLRSDGVTWRKAFSLTDRRYLPVPPSEGLLVRLRQPGAATQFGAARTHSFRKNLATGLQFASSPFPVVTSPRGLGAWVDVTQPEVIRWFGSNSPATADSLFLFSGGAFVQYYLRADGATWRRTSGLSNYAAEPILKPGESILVRRANSDSGWWFSAPVP